MIRLRHALGAPISYPIQATTKRRLSNLNGMSGFDILPVGLRHRQIEVLRKRFAPGDCQLWNDIAGLADSFWASDCGLRQAHHLMMAVGNFKRQAGTIRLKEPLSWTPRKSSGRDTCMIGGYVLKRDQLESWKSFCGEARGVTGFGVATTTTLLSALWPDHHVIIDQRALRALIGLRLAWDKGCPISGTKCTPESLDTVTWEDYWTDSEFKSSYRKEVLASAGPIFAPVDVERALFELDKLHGPKFGVDEGRDWKIYGTGLVGIAEGAA